MATTPEELNAARLRRDVFRQQDPAASAALLAELVAAEKAAAKARPARQADPSATILRVGDTTPKNQLSAASTGLKIEVTLKMSRVPGSIVHLLDPEQHPLVAVSAQNGKPDRIRRVRVTTFVDGYSARAVDTMELGIGAPAQSLKQLPTFFPDRLATVRELTRATVNTLVEDLDGPVELQNTAPVWIAPPTTALLSATDPATGALVDFTEYLAAFVTPNAPEIMSFLRTAAAANPGKRLPGYQGDSALGVDDQVRAIYDALKADGNITYINSVVAFGAEEGSFNQRVRLPRESLQSQSANCIDGAVLVASLLEAATLNPALVIVPGHAFVAWETWDRSLQWKYLETTMIGTHDFAAACQSAEAMVQQYTAGDPTALMLRPLRDARAKGLFPMA